MDGETTRTRVFLATALAGAAHLVLDGAASRITWTTPPYLLLDHASETFRDLLNLDRTTILVAVSVISAGVNGAIAGLFAAALRRGRSDRTLKLGLALSALWIFSGGLMTLVYLRPRRASSSGASPRGSRAPSPSRGSSRGPAPREVPPG